MHYFQAQMIQVTQEVEFNHQRGTVHRRVFDENGLTSHIALNFAGKITGLIDVRDMAAVSLVRGENIT